MKRSILFGLMLISVFSITASANKVSPSVEYLRQCTQYGAGWYIIPGTDKCLFPTTGLIKYESEQGTQTSQSELAYRVTLLQKHLAELKALKAQLKTSESRN